MAEYVEKNLEKLIPTLEQLRDAQLFSEDEIKVVVRRCKRLEYKLHKRVKNSRDYCAYADYVESLMKLVHCRRKRNNYWERRHEIDHRLATKCDTLYVAACDRFPADVSLWRRRVDFNERRRAPETVSGVYARALQLHAADMRLTLDASRYEFERRQSAKNARLVLHRALRHAALRRNAHIWSALVKLEVDYVQRLCERREVLLRSAQSKAEAAADAKLEECGGDDAPPPPATGELVEFDAKTDGVTGLQLAKIALDEGEKAVDDPVQLRAAVWRQVRRCEVARQWAAELLLSLHEEAGSVHAWLCLADNAWAACDEADDVDALMEIDGSAAQPQSAQSSPDDPLAELAPRERAKAIVLERAVTHLDTEAMWTAYLQYCFDLAQSANNCDAHVLYAAAAVKRCPGANMSRDTFDSAWKLLHSCVCDGRVRAACLDALADLVAKAEALRPADGALYANKVRLRWEIVVHGRCDAAAHSSHDMAEERKRIKAMFNEGLKKLPAAECAPLWLAALDWTFANEPSAGGRRRFARSALALCGGGELKRRYVQLAVGHCDAADGHDDDATGRWLDAAAAAFDIVRAAPPVPAHCYGLYLDELTTLFRTSRHEALRQRVKAEILKTYDGYTIEHGGDSADSWVSYAQFALEADMPQLVTTLRQRALANLHESLCQPFVELWTKTFVA